MKRDLRWLIKALSDRGYAMIESPVRNAGAFAFRKGVDVARAFGILPKPQPGDGILIVNLTSHFGDGVMLLPMLEAIHAANPATAIDIACSRGVDTLFSAVPLLRHVYAAPLTSAPPLKLVDVIRRRLAIVRWYRAALKDLHPAVCLMPRWGDDLFGSLSLAYLVGAPVRIAYDSTVDHHQRNAPQRDRMITHRVTGGRGLHEPLRFLHVAQAGGLIPQGQTFTTNRVVSSLQGIAAAIPWQPLQRRLGLPASDALVVLAPGASSPNKTWPQEHWVAAAGAILHAGFRIILLSGPSDRAHAESIAAALNDERVHVVAGTTSLPESIALLSHAAAFLGNDSGPGHAAGALGLPSVILFSSLRDVYPDNSFSPQRVRPMGPYVRTLHPAALLDRCRDACITPFPHCIATIPVDEAVTTLLSLITEKARG